MERVFESLIFALSSKALPAHLASRRKALIDLAEFQAARLGHAHPYVIVGLIGPNNAGKSTFFSKFTGCDISPPSADGGFTTRLVAAGHPETIDRLVAESRFGAFQIVEISRPLDDITRKTAPTNTLFIARSQLTPRHLIIIDSPDFDSIYDANHEVSAGLAQISDVIACIVTKHTFANAKVRSVLGAAVKNKRPYFVVYNEATDSHTALRHLQALVDGFSSPPFGLFYAPLDTNIQREPHLLQVLHVDDGKPLNLASLPSGEVQRLLIGANASKLGALANGVTEIAQAWTKHAAAQEAFLDSIQRDADALGQAVASSSYPLEPLRDAFLDVLNEQDLRHKLVRVPVQHLAKSVVWTTKQVRRHALTAGKWALKEGIKRADQKLGTRLQEQIQTHHTQDAGIKRTTQLEGALILKEQQTFHSEWTRFTEAVEKELRSAGLRPEEKARFAAEFSPDRLAAITHSILESLATDLIPSDYRAFCRREVRSALERRGDTRDLQWIATSIAATPAVAGISTSIATGGFGGEDVAIGLAAALTTPLFDRMMGAVGGETVRRIQAQWTAERVRRIAETTLQHSAPHTLGEWLSGISAAREYIPKLEGGTQELQRLLEDRT